MPNIITHTLFADELLDLLPADAWLKKRKKLVEIGSNGPDFLFFHGMSVKRGFRPSVLNAAGSKLHKGHVNAFYRSALDSIRREKDENIRLDMEAYVIGHLCHWALDSVMHPYVYYKTGTCSKRSSWNHHRLESLIDAIFLKVKRGINIDEFDASKIAHAEKEEARAVARIYVPAFKTIFQEDIPPHAILESLEDWEFLQKVFRDPHGKKAKVLKRAEKVSNLNNLLSGYLVPSQAIDNYDVMNLLHKEWKHPAGIFTSADSLFDLYDAALVRAEKAITLFLAALKEPACQKEFFDFIDDRTYNLGINEPLTMQYFDLETYI